MNDHEETEAPSVVPPLSLVGAALVLLAIPYFTGDRWTWNGIPTDYAAYVFLAVGILWLPFAIKGVLDARE